MISTIEIHTEEEKNKRWQMFPVKKMNWMYCSFSVTYIHTHINILVCHSLSLSLCACVCLCVFCFSIVVFKASHMAACFWVHTRKKAQFNIYNTLNHKPIAIRLNTGEHRTLKKWIRSLFALTVFLCFSGSVTVAAADDRRMWVCLCAYEMNT